MTTGWKRGTATREAKDGRPSVEVLSAPHPKAMPLRITPGRARAWLAAIAMYVPMLVLVAYPVALMLVRAFTHPRTGQWDLTNFARLVATPLVMQAARNTLLISLLTVVIAVPLGVFLAWAVARTDMPFKRVLEPLNLLPFYLSSVVGALSWQVIAAPKTGLVNQLAAQLWGSTGPVVNIYSVGGIALVLGLFYAPYVYLSTLGTLQNMDAALEEAARMAGASIAYATVRITLALAMPAVLAAAALVFVTSAGIFGVPQVLGIPGRVHTISTLIYRYIHDYPPRYNLAAALSTVLLVITAGLTWLQLWVTSRRKFTMVTGRGYRPAPIRLGRWRWAVLGVNLAYLAMVGVPFVCLVLVSLQDAWTGHFAWDRITLANYRYVLFTDATSIRGFRNSLIISPLGAVLGVAWGLMVALIAARTSLPLRRGLLTLSMAPVTVPGIVLGLAFLFAWIRTPLYGTLWVIMLAYVVHYLPSAVTALQAQLLTLSSELDEASRVSGATWFQAATRIVVPLLRRGLIAVWLLLFVTFIREVSSSMMLFTYGTETLSIALIRIIDYAPYGVAAAFGVLQTALLLAAVWLLRRVGGGASGQLGTSG